ncbi:MAG: hypothetical protein JWO67_2691 [Streptosporangiaceae bacterium]|nr:hypothetical protein [Streptosporangiaceae bacterium]
MKGTKPVLAGYRIEWDAEAKEWLATHETRGTELRGKNQRALDVQRNLGVIQAGNELLEICQYALTHGYTPPPQP